MLPAADPKTLRVTGLVLAGGQGQRMGGQDKGLIALAGKPMIAHVLMRLRPQVDEILISANRHRADYLELGYRVISDEQVDYLGPLAGILCGLRHATSHWLATAPCDSPFLPDHLVARLQHAVEPDQIAVAHACGELQPVFALIPTQHQESLREFLAGGRRKITDWYRLHSMVAVDFSDQDDAFDNINTEEDRQRAALRLN